ncbi:putative hydrolase of the HAD superfamily [Arboricoccus pini]|uniref:Putative hydrolase of the HAD superfamily n=1 Tax=Arboricoccus pini TaxID=1963835 RepID=A0A212RSJ2_9PROT|nr:HAD family hydrolase [Arboricoccus pini]SNB75536.1 putative hydrolase of the HAD superfamily [Arboricoccus pini]
MPLALIGLDADDTLWHNETYFRLTHQRFADLLAPFADPDDIEARLLAVEERNLRIYGYGAKGFTLSMLETALEISHGQVSSAILAEVLEAGRAMLSQPVEPLPGVGQALSRLAERAKLVLITKGDLFHQESKLAASGLGDFFSGVEIVSNKSPEVYARVFRRHGAEPAAALMAGNSVRSDILPPLDCGSYAALIPYHLIWAHEAAAAPHDHPRFRQLDSLDALPAWIDSLDS